MATTRRAKTASAFAAITTSWSSAVGYAFAGATSRQDPAGPRADHSPDLPVRDRRLHQREHGFVDRDVDLLAATAPCPFLERGEGADDCEQPGERVTDRDAGTRRRAVGLTGRVPDPAHRFADRAEAGLGRARTGLAEAGDVHEHDAGVLGLELRIRHAPTRQRARLEVLEDDVAAAARYDAPRPARARSRRSTATDRLLRAIAGHQRLRPSTRTP